MKATDYFSLHKKHFDFKEFLRNAFSEDIGDGDHTTRATIPVKQRGKMHLLVKEEGILAGMEVTEKIFALGGKNIRFKKQIRDGASVKPGQIAFVVEGNTQMLLTTERLVLNIMQRMSGIATATAHLQQLCKGTKAKVIDTRKTTPGFRFFEKWAVVIGGGANHRYGLFDMILIKDNHIDFAGGITPAIRKAQAYLKLKKKQLQIEVEVRNLNDVKEVLQCGGVDRILLDNFSPAETKKAVQLINGKIKTESSGGINAKNIAAYARAGVDFISVGALTHHVSSLDLSLKYVKS